MALGQQLDNVYHWLKAGLMTVVICLGYGIDSEAQQLEQRSLPVVPIACKHPLSHTSHRQQATQAVPYPAGYLNYRVNHYNLYLKPDLTLETLSGRTDFHFSPTGRLDTLVFDLSNNLNLDSVYYRGRKVSHQRNSTYEWGVVPLTPAPRATDTVQVWFSGRPVTTGIGSITFGNHQTGRVMATLSQPYGARDWWACRQDYFQKVDSIDMFLVASQPGYKGIGIGLLQDTSVTSDGTVWHWKHKYPVATYLIASTFSNFVLSKDTVALTRGVIPLENYSFPQARNTWAASFGITKQQLHLFERLFTPYPFDREKYGHVQFLFGGGMEHQTNSSMGSVDFWLQSHELGHQWFGDYVTCKGMRELWLNEGFASYCEYLALEETGQTQAMANWLIQASSLSQVPGAMVYKTDTSTISTLFDFVSSYRKPAMVLHILRKTIGDQAFFTALRSYLQDPDLAYGFSRMGNLIRHVEAAAGRNMDAFFQAWIMTPGYPEHTVVANQNVDTVIVSIAQRGIGSTSLYPGAVPITFERNGAPDTTIYFDITNSINAFRFTSQLRVTGFRLNDTYESITAQQQGRVGTGPLSLVGKLKGALAAWPNPLTDALYISIPNGLSSDQAGQLSVYDQAGKLVAMDAWHSGRPVNTANWPRGHYRLQLTNQHGTWNTHVVKP